MLIKYWMSRPAVTVDADDTLQKAAQLMQENEIRFLPVLSDGELVGILTDRDIKRTSPSDQKEVELYEALAAISEVAVRHAMSPDPITARPDSTIEEVTLELLLNKISGVPVVDECAAVVGVVTATDIFQMLLTLAGFSKKGVQFAFLLTDRPGAIKEVTDIVRDYGGRIASVLTTRERAPRGRLKVFIRAYNMDAVACRRLKQVLRKRTVMLYAVDHETNTREIYTTNHAKPRED